MLNLRFRLASNLRNTLRDISLSFSLHLIFSFTFRSHISLGWNFFFWDHFSLRLLFLFLRSFFLDIQFYRLFLWLHLTFALFFLLFFNHSLLLLGSIFSGLRGFLVLLETLGSRPSRVDSNFWSNKRCSLIL